MRLANELLIKIFEHVTPETLDNLSLTCRHFHHLIQAHKSAIHEGIVCNAYRCRPSSNPEADYIIHRNIDKASSTFRVIGERNLPHELETFPKDQRGKKNPEIMFLWSSLEGVAYLATHYKNIIVSLDLNRRNVNASYIQSTPNNNFIFSHSFTVLETQEPIGLILSNRKNLIACFNDGVGIKVFDLDKMELVSTINSVGELSLMTSMNFYGEFLIVTGLESYVYVLDIYGVIVCKMLVPSRYVDRNNRMARENTINVCLYENMFAVAYFDGYISLFTFDPTKRIQDHFQAENFNVKFFKDFWLSHLHNPHSTSRSRSNSRPVTMVFQDDQYISMYANSPLTLYLNGHFLITNTNSPHAMVVYDLISGKHYELSEFAEYAKKNMYIEPWRDLRFADFAHGLFFSSVISDDERPELLLWDFLGSERNLVIDRVECDWLDLWIGYQI